MGLDPGAMALINHVLPLPNKPTGTDGYNYTTQNLVNNNIYQLTERVDYALNDNNHIFARCSYEHGSQGQPQVPYYSPGSVMGSVNTPGGGVLNNIHVSTASANYVRVISPTMTNELFGTLVYFKQAFDAKTPSALTSAAIGYPYQGTYNNGSKDFPQFQDYGFDGLPLAIQPDFTYGSPSLKKFQPSVGDNLTKVWSKHTVKTGIFLQRITNNQTITNGVTNGDIRMYYFPLPAVPSTTTPAPILTVRRPLGRSTSPAATTWQTSCRAKSRVSISRTSCPVPISITGTLDFTGKTPGVCGPT
jgi:hypothetical protein